MQRYYGTAQDKQGNCIPNAVVTVYTAGSVSPLPNIYATTGSRTAPAAISNPITADANGNFGFSAANGNYDLTISGGGISTLTIPNVVLFDGLDVPGVPGAITSVGLSMPAEFSVAGSPITTGAGTLSVTKASQTANYFYAAPDGSAGAPTFRAMTGNDLPAGGAGAATYGSASQIPVFTLDAKGRVSSVTPTTVAAAWASITGKPTTVATSGLTDAAATGTYNTWTKSQNVNMQSFSPAALGTVTIDSQAGNVVYIQLPAGNITVANPTGTSTGASAPASTLTIIFKQDGAGSRTITWGGKFKFANATSYQPSATASSVSALFCQYEPNNDIWLCSGISNYA